jgi:hypothetical protein
MVCEPTRALRQSSNCCGLLLQAFNLIRSDTQLMEELAHNLLYRFAAFGVDEPVLGGDSVQDGPRKEIQRQDGFVPT